MGCVSVMMCMLSFWLIVIRWLVLISILFVMRWIMFWLIFCCSLIMVFGCSVFSLFSGIDVGGSLKCRLIVRLLSECGVLLGGVLCVVGGVELVWVGFKGIFLICLMVSWLFDGCLVIFYVGVVGSCVMYSRFCLCVC